VILDSDEVRVVLSRSLGLTPKDVLLVADAHGVSVEIAANDQVADSIRAALVGQAQRDCHVGSEAALIFETGSASFDEAVTEAIEFRRAGREFVSVKHNGVEVEIEPEDDLAAVVKRWRRHARLEERGA
jgi:hypothetical protein